MKMPKKEEAYVCKKCGYVLAKKAVAIAGYESQTSLKHVHCPGCGKIITHVL